MHERHVTRVPDVFPDDEAAAVPEAFITAHDALVTQAELSVGDMLLVNGANGGVGTAAVQLVSPRARASSRPPAPGLNDWRVRHGAGGRATDYA